MATYAITKLHLTGNLAGLRTEENSRVEMPLGKYTDCVTGARYRVIYCAENFTIADWTEHI